MNALRLDPSERTFATFYEPRSGPRLSRKTVIAVSITALCYGAIGFYFMNQKYQTSHFEQPVDDTPIVVQPWLPKPPEPEPVKQPTASAPATVPARTPANVPTTIDNTLPFEPTDLPATDVIPTTAEPTTLPPAPIEQVAPPTAPSVIRSPVWISRPTPEQVSDLYPTRAFDRGMTGSATLLCGILANGAMTNCEVISETPAGYAFGKAALSMARYFKISPKTVDGQPVQGFKVRIPVTFSLPN